MNVISIGRSPENKIIIDDMQVSRRHALIRVSSLGKYDIISTGTNGTKVNGNQVLPNVPYPLKRGDSVIFANVASLDWSCVPDPLRPFKIGLISLGVVCAVALVVFGIVKLVNNYTGSDIPLPEQQVVTEQTDSVKNKEKEQLQDSIKKDCNGLDNKNLLFEDKVRSKSSKNKKSKIQDSKEVEKSKNDKSSTPKSDNPSSEENQTWGRR